MLIKGSKKGLKEISYEEVNDKYTKFTGGHSRKSKTDRRNINFRREIGE
jgi:hypothetical protein